MRIEMGAEVRDVITGFRGRVTGRAEWITGCNQYCVVPPVGENGEDRDAKWHDEQRLEVVGPALALPEAADERPPRQTGGPQADAPPAR